MLHLKKNQAFIFIVQELVDGFQKEKFSKSACMGAYWSIGTTSLEFYEGNMDSQKYVSILQNKINKLK